MRKSEEAVAWVVYKMAVAKKPDGKTPCASRPSGTSGDAKHTLPRRL